MMKFFTAIGLAILLLAIQPVDAAECKVLPKAKILKKLQGKRVAKTLSIKRLKNKSAAPIYRVKQLLKSGRVRVLNINACSGKRVK